MYKAAHRFGRQSMAAPQASQLGVGETLQDLARRITRPHGELEAVAFTTMAMYAAAKNSRGDVEALVIPYAIDYKQPAPRDVRYGIYPEASNPEWAYAPPAILNRLTAAATPEAAEWRKRCWENQQLRSLDPLVWQRGDVLELQKAVQSRHGQPAPGFYVLLESVNEYSKIQRLRDVQGPRSEGDRAIVVKGLAAAARKVPLSPDPAVELARHADIASFGVVRVASDSEYSSHYVVLGHRLGGEVLPLAKADAEERDEMLERLMQIAKAKREAARDYEQGPAYQLAAREGLLDAVVAQGSGAASPLLDALDVHVKPVTDRALDQDFPDGPSMG